MADLLRDMDMRARFTARTQGAFMRSFRAMTSGRTVSIRPFNIETLLRLHDMNPPIYVCASLLIEADVEQDPAVIRESIEFSSLLDRLQIQPTSTVRDARNTHRASLVLLEVFIYMILIGRARKDEDERRAAQKLATSEEEEFI